MKRAVKALNRISVQQLAFSYNGRDMVFENFSAEFSGGPTAIIGQNGAGKTTLVKLIKGLLKPDKGRILINGIPAGSMTVRDLAKTVGLVFQNPNDQIFKPSVLEEVTFGPKIIGFSGEKAERSAKEALEMLGISHLKHENPYDLNLSQRKLVSIASILSMDPDILIFDEPTMGQDYEGREIIKRTIRHLRERGKLVLAILHDMDFVAENFDRAVVLHEGKIIADGHPREVFAREEIVAQAGLELPNAVKLGKRLGLKDIFLTKNELIRYLKERASGR